MAHTHMLCYRTCGAPVGLILSHSITLATRRVPVMYGVSFLLTFECSSREFYHHMCHLRCVHFRRFSSLLFVQCEPLLCPRIELTQSFDLSVSDAGARARRAAYVSQ